MQPRDGASHCKTEPAPICRSRLLEPTVFTHRIFAKLCGDSGAAVADDDFQIFTQVAEAELDAAVVGPLFKSIIHEVRDGPADHLAVADVRQIARALEFQ